MPAFKDLTGQRFGRLVVVCRSANKKKTTMWECKCDCGATKTIASSSLVQGVSQSCGCFHKEQLSKRVKKHGKAGTRLYGVLCGMIYRCEDENNPNYKYYGGKGVFVCKEWRDDPNAFISWAENEGLVEGLQIDRIDSSGPYSPENCRVATPSQNTQNRAIAAGASNYKGVAKNGKGWSAKITVNKKRIHLGTFKTAKEAAIAYNKACKEYFKEFAVLNIIN